MNDIEMIKATVLGLGPRGRMLCKTLGQMANVNLSAAFTRNHHKGIRLSDELKMPVYTDWHDMMASQRPDAVFIAVPISQAP